MPLKATNYIINSGRMEHQSTKYYVAKLIYKSISNIITPEEEAILNEWLLKEENRELYNYIIDKDNVENKLSIYNQIDTKEVYSRLSTQIQDNQSTYSISRYKTWVKYSAAAILVGLFATGYFFRDNFFKSDVESTAPIIVDTNIKPGTDKATLTLEDGSQIILEKGKAIQTLNANSDGEKLIYEAGRANTNEVAYHYLNIPRGGQYFVELSDGTKVWLNSESKLKYPTAFKAGEDRIVELLYGEAYFDVSPSTNHNGSKFKVVHHSQEIEVLGTEFNLKAYKDESKVFTTLVEGKVNVEDDNTIQSLIPGQQSILNMVTKEISVKSVDIDSETSWRRGVFSFSGKPLKDVMKVISRWYDVDVVFENKDLESVKFKGNLNKDRSIERILSLMLSTKLNAYEIKDKTIILK